MSSTRVVSFTRSANARDTIVLLVDREDPDAPVVEASQLLDVLMDLPVETRRAFYTLLTTEMFDGFNAAPSPKAKVHEWPPRPRRPE